MSLIQNTTPPVNLTKIAGAAGQVASTLATSVVPSLSSLASLKPNMASIADDLKSKTEGLVTSAATSAIGSLSGSVESMAKNVSSTLSTLASNTTLPSAQTLRTAIGDPMISAFTSQIPNVTSFITSSISDQLQNLDFSKLLNSSGKGLAAFGKAALGAVAGRLGIAIPSSGKGLGDLKSMVAGALTSGSIGGLVGKITSAVGIKLPKIPSIVTTGLSSLLSTAKSVLGDAMPKNILSTFNGRIPTLTQQNGRPFANTPSNTDPGVLGGVTRVLSTLGVPNPFAGAQNPNSTQNLWGAALNSCVENGLAPAVQALCTSPHGSTSYGQQMAANVLQNNASTANVGILSALTSSVRGNRLPKKKNLLRRILANMNLTRTASSAVTDIMGNLGINVSSVFGTGTHVNQVPVWNANILSQTNPSIAGGIGIDMLRQLTQGVPMTITWNQPGINR